MKKLILAAGLAAAVIAIVGGGLAVWAVNAGGSSRSALAASKDQQDIFSALGSQQGTTTSDQPYLGAQITRTSDGLTVSAVIADSPAEKAGLKRGDVIKSIDGTQVSDMQALLSALKDKKPGDTVTLSITRDGTQVSDMQALLNALKGKKPGDTVTLSITRDGSAQDITATLEARPAPLASANSLFPELSGIPSDQLFSHIMGGSFQFKDNNNNSHTVTVDLGTVTAVDTNAKTITADLNAGGSKTYTVSTGVITVPTDLSQFQNGDKIAALSVDGNLRAVAKNPGSLLGKGGFGGMGGWQGFGGMRGMGGQQKGLATPESGSGQGTTMPRRSTGSGL